MKHRMKQKIVNIRFPLYGAGLFLMMVVFGHHAFAQNIVDPCPMPETLAGKSPSDMAAVQSDIDILTLCVRRASLLKQLNDLAADSSPEALLYGMGGAAPAGPDGRVPNFNDANFEPVDAELFRLPDTADASGQPNTGQANSAGTQGTGLPDAVDVEASKDQKTFKVIGIFGNQDTGITARLRAPDGGVVQAKKDDILKEGVRVTAVSVTGVTISENGASKTLDWE